MFNVDLSKSEPLDCDFLYSHQREAAGLIRTRGGALLALTMGSGKTLTTTAALAHNVDPLPRTLIVGPLMSRGSWCGPKSDPYKFFGIDVHFLEGKKSACREAFDGAVWVFCHYDILDAWFPFIATCFQPEAVVCEESHIVKNAKAVRSKKMRNITRLYTVKTRIALSGTPVLNNIMDLWPQLDFVNPDAWGKRFQFGERYTDVEYTEYGRKFEGQNNTLELQKRLDAIMYRKDRSELLASLPKLTRQSIEAILEEEAREDYKLAFLNIKRFLKEKVNELADKMTGDKLMALTKLTEIAGLGKAKTTADLCISALDGHDKVVVFCWHKSTAKKIKQLLLKKKKDIEIYGPVSGDMPAKKRFKTMDYFAETDKPAVFIATIASAGIALNNLVAASCVIFNDLYWLPGPLLQAEARVHRDGQVRGVNIYYVYASGTVDDQMLDKLFRKAEAIEAASAGDEATGLATTFVGGEDDSGEAQSALDELCAQLMDEFGEV